MVWFSLWTRWSRYESNKKHTETTEAAVLRCNNTWQRQDFKTTSVMNKAPLIITKAKTGSKKEISGRKDCLQSVSYGEYQQSFASPFVPRLWHTVISSEIILAESAMMQSQMTTAQERKLKFSIDSLWLSIDSHAPRIVRVVIRGACWARSPCAPRSTILFDGQSGDRKSESIDVCVSY